MSRAILLLIGLLAAIVIPWLLGGSETRGDQGASDEEGAR